MCAPTGVSPCMKCPGLGSQRWELIAELFLELKIYKDIKLDISTKINVFYFQEMSSGNSWAVYCRESEKDRSKMEVDFLSI